MPSYVTWPTIVPPLVTRTASYPKLATGQVSVPSNDHTSAPLSHPCMRPTSHRRGFRRASPSSCPAHDECLIDEHARLGACPVSASPPQRSSVEQPPDDVGLLDERAGEGLRLVWRPLSERPAPHAFSNHTAGVRLEKQRGRQVLIRR